MFLVSEHLVTQSILFFSFTTGPSYSSSQQRIHALLASSPAGALRTPLAAGSLGPLGNGNCALPPSWVHASFVANVGTGSLTLLVVVFPVVVGTSVFMFHVQLLCNVVVPLAMGMGDGVLPVPNKETKREFTLSVCTLTTLLPCCS